MDFQFHQDEYGYICFVDDEVQYSCSVCAFVQHDHKCFSPVTPSGDDRHFIINVTGINTKWPVPNPIHASCTTEHILLDIIESSIEEDMSPVLVHFGIPEEFRSAMMATISEAAKNKSITTDRIYKTLRMNVLIHIDRFSIDDNDEGVEASIEDQHQILTPASRSSIEELERVGIRGGGREDEEEEGSSNCTICLEDFEVGAEAIRMPCSHLFHSSCILEWLNYSNVCPLCRFRLPLERG